MRILTTSLLALSTGFILAQSGYAAPLNYEDYPIIKLRSLDKITARTMNFEAKVGSTIRFGDIFIKVQACRKPPPIEKNEAAGFLQIYQADQPTPNEDTDKTKSSWIFSGWMFASSPAISAMDHPIYDVWVLDCLGRDPEPLPPPEQQAAESEAKENAENKGKNGDETPPADKENTPTESSSPDGANKETAPADDQQNSPIPSSSGPMNQNESAPIKSENNQDDGSGDQTSTIDRKAEPSVDEILQPEKAVTSSDPVNDNPNIGPDGIYKPPARNSEPVIDESEQTPITEPSQPAPSSEGQSPPQSDAPLDGIY